jgi:hypothetical protein
MPNSFSKTREKKDNPKLNKKIIEIAKNIRDKVSQERDSAHNTTNTTNISITGTSR